MTARLQLRAGKIEVTNTSALFISDVVGVGGVNVAMAQVLTGLVIVDAPSQDLLPKPVRHGTF